jgi:hypothetical protein
MIRLERLAYLPNCTLGRLLYGKHALATIERPWLNNQPNISCIPSGQYICKRYSSEKYPNTYEITGVPHRTHILFHIANYATEVRGCVALGLSIHDGEMMVVNSRLAVERFMNYLDGRESFDLEIGQYIEGYNNELTSN